MKRIFAWAGAALLAASLTLGGQTQGQSGPRGVDKDGDGKCDICGRPVSAIGQARRDGPGQGRGRGNGCRMRSQNCQCSGCQAAQAQPQKQDSQQQQKK